MSTRGPIAPVASSDWVRRALAACAALSVLGTACSADAASYITIDLGGYVGTHAVVINDQGAVTGWYGCGGAVIGSFVRAADGAITTFSVITCSGDKVQGTYASAINDKGVVTGTISNYPGDVGFVREADGTIEEFNCTGRGINTTPVSINDKGAITGVCSTDKGFRFGFVRSPHGKLSNFSAYFNGSRSVDTEPRAINGSGVIAGIYVDGEVTQHGFIRPGNGPTWSFDPPGSTETWVSGISGDSVITGYYRDSINGLIHGYLRAADGTFTSFDPSGAVETNPTAINSRGVVTGSYGDSEGKTHGFARSPAGTIRVFDPPQSAATIPLAINGNGIITGIFMGQNTYGFLTAR